MKLDLSAAWERGTASIGANREIVLVLAGVFLFIPLFAIFLVLLGSGFDFTGNPDADQAQQAMRFAALIGEFLGQYWWLLLIAFILQAAGSIAIIRILGDAAKPTVGDVLKLAARLVPTLLAANILSGLVVQLPSLLAELAGGGETAVGATINLIGLPFVFYLSVKFILIAPAVALEGQANPLKAIARSWRVTKGNSLRIFAFFLLFAVAALVLFLVLSLVFGLVFALLGARGEEIGSAAFWAFFLTTTYVIYYAVIAAMYRQLSASRPSVPTTAGD
ncbi:glycerophosphoryl diester phosphodiesterase membrane domain-containing protein [Qipengyuania spongiae]|uniref:Glycerophosphoryl diester phosphodiesterase membrane domain-containing protein n=1 Tax=Qipengyuania spongiae TaxID=2909673 RepID=A0ABY5T0H9_9SPHN|nr:glycerophosphoryl diester phosphodiesterase membrane domain-containing protein [Qipengyuania spongiae]UVI40305.1 glycerophosphoryl diester phosphodiesterase membrane domain-containing protein [Qipengyuania spongiae]